MRYEDMNLFKSLAHQYVFALIDTDRDLRMRLLGIHEHLYHDNERAKEWYDHIVETLNDGTINDVNIINNAIAKLDNLYKRMTN